MAKASRIIQLTMNESSPEKAGVGGSIPSLATTFSNTYRPSTASFGSNWFQFQPADTVSCNALFGHSTDRLQRRFPQLVLLIFDIELFDKS